MSEHIFYSIDKIKELKDIDNCIILTSTVSLCTAISNYYFKDDVYAISEIISRLIPDWENSTQDIDNYIGLKKCLNEYINKSELECQKLETECQKPNLEYLKRNLSAIWKSIKVMTEIGLSPEDIEKISVDEQRDSLTHFANVWKAYMQTDAGRELFESNPVSAIEAMDEDCFGEILDSFHEKKMNESNRKRICLVGFYFITPIQKRLVNRLVELGHEVEYRIFYNDDYPFFTDAWCKSFEQCGENGLQQYGKPLIDHNKVVGDNAIYVNEFSSEYLFTKRIKEYLDKGDSVYSPEPSKCNELLRAYFGDQYGNWAIGATPFGKYLANLLKTYNAETGRLEFTYELIYGCFESGYLGKAGGNNASDLMYEIEVLEPFFSDLKEDAEWRLRFRNIKKNKAIIDGLPANSPLKLIGAYAISADKLNSIQYFLDNKIVHDAQLLFAEGEDGINLYGNICEIISQVDEMHIYRDECLIFADNNFQAVSKTDLPSAIEATFDLLRGEVGNVDGYDFRRRKVMNISLIEAEMLNNHGQHVHLVMTDAQNMPGPKGAYTWPITDKVIAALKESRTDTKTDIKEYISCQENTVVNNPFFNRYLFFVFLELAEGRDGIVRSIDWVNIRNGKTVETCPYIKLIEDELTIESEYLQSDMRFNELCTTETFESDKLSVEDEAEEYSRFKELDLARPYPYVSRFHYSFLASQLINYFGLKEKCDKDIARANVRRMFPFFSELEMKQIADFASSQHRFEGDTSQELSRMYEQMRDDLGKIKRRTNVNSGKFDIRAEEDDAAKCRAEECMYCPVQSVCLNHAR